VVVAQYILGVLIIVVGLLLSIGLHEVGHLIPAKRFGVYVPQYMIGLGPTLWSRKFGETEYGVKAIPLGGYISMAGMFPPARKDKTSENRRQGLFRTLMQDAREASAESVSHGGESRAFYRLAIWKRIIIMLGGPTMNLVIGVVLLTITFCAIGIPQSTTTIDSVSKCVIPVSSQRTSCELSDPLAPAAAAGVIPGDRIVSIDGTPISTWEQATTLIRAAPNTELSIVVSRSGEEIALAATPVLDERYALTQDGSVATDTNGKAITEKVGFLGLGPTSTYVPQPFSSVIPVVGQSMVGIGTSLVTLPQKVVDLAQSTFGSEKRDPNGLIGVVGIGRLGGEIASSTEFSETQRVQLLLSVLASLNIALFVFNLVPLLPLDGGHVAGAIWEGTRRLFAKLMKRRDPGPVDIAKLIPLTFAVVILLIGLTAFVVIADVINPVTIQ
jgi:membrane-associated protease RseP (regulator of RpoE activity)